MSDVLDIHDLKASFKTHRGPIEVLHGIDLTIRPGECVALVGESGSGKSVTARIILGLIRNGACARIGGDIHFDGRDLLRLSAKKHRALRGTEIAMIFQDPTSSLNPVFKISSQFIDVLRRREPQITRATALARAEEALVHVMIPDPARVLESYPFQLSGGLNQRVMIAMALANRPKLLIADEPGTALDVKIQAQTLKLMRNLVAEYGAAVLFISHNLGVVREFADRISVIYCGRIVEDGPVSAIFAQPGHAYTSALLAAVPRITGKAPPEIAETSDTFMGPTVHHGDLTR